METIGKIRRWHRVDKLSISEIAKRLGASRNTVAKYLSSEVTKPRYKPREKRFPIMGPWASRLFDLLDEDAGKPLKQRRNGQRLYDTLGPCADGRRRQHASKLALQRLPGHDLSQLDQRVAHLDHLVQT